MQRTPAPPPPGPSHVLWQLERDVDAIRREWSNGPPTFLSSKSLLDTLCLRMNVMSFVDLNIGAPYAIPAIRQVIDIENSLWDFVGVFVTSRAVATVHDAEAAFLQLHRVASFDALGVGTSFALAPAVAYHFQLQSPLPVAKLTTKDVLVHLRDFRFMLNRQTTDPAIFLAYLAEKVGHPAGSLGVAVQNMPRSLELMRRIYYEEQKQLRELENDFRKDIADRVFEIAKTKFSAENRTKAIDDALTSQSIALPEGNQKANVNARLASTFLQKVSRLDAELDHQICKYRDRLPKNIATTIAAQDVKLRNKVVHKKHQHNKSRATVIAWVLCSIIAKTRVLLDAENLEPMNKQTTASDDDECKCCCVGKDACQCQCTCSCHSVDDDSDDDDVADDDDTEAKVAKALADDAPPPRPTPPAAATSEMPMDSTKLDAIRKRLERLADEATDAADTIRRLRAIEVDFEVPSLLALAVQPMSPPLPLPLQTPAWPSVLRPQVEALVYQCRVALHDFATPPSPALKTMATAAIQAEFGWDAVPAGVLASAAPSAAAVVFPYPLLTGTTPPTLSLPLATVLSSIRALPCLVDLEAALGWATNCAPEFGPFLPFVQQHLPHLPLLRLPGPTFVKLDATSTPASLQMSATTGDDLAVHMLSVVAKTREACPWELLEAAATTVLKQVAAPCAVVLAALARVPHPCLLPLVAPSLLKVLATVVHRMPEELWRACRTDADQMRLALLGTLANVPLWQVHHQQFLATGRLPPLAAPSVAAVVTPVALPMTPTMPKDAVASTDTTSTASVTAPAFDATDAADAPTVDGTACRELIARIRRENFGIGLAVTPETHMFLQRQHQRLERALKRLSEELYAASTHFVLELLQNADDNAYADGVVPRVTFAVSPDNINFFCNEIGFQPGHIRALCDVGASTKAQATGFIGQKGIGFKSVFAVTHAPEIHSNGYHLRFDASPDHDLGPDHVNYVLPYWIDVPRFPDPHTGTHMHFPLHPQAQQQLQTTCALLRQIEPSILLFLRQLQSLEITNAVDGTAVQYAKSWRSPEVVELRSASTVQEWYVAKKTLQVPAAGLRDQVAPGALTTIQVAFPIADGDVHPLQAVFAYLPLQSYGFRCILQADFEVPSSREAVLDSAWNRWLLVEFPALFVDAFTALVQLHPHLIRLVPLVHEVQPPFHVCAQEICVRLQSAPIVQTTAGDWVAPTAVLDPLDAFGDDTAPTPSVAVLREVVDKAYLHPSFAAWLSPEMKRALGIQALNSAHVLHVASAVAARIDLDLAWRTRLLGTLASLAHRERQVAAVARQAQQVPLLPVQTATGGFALATPASTVFAPTDVAMAIPFASAIQLMATPPPTPTTQQFLTAAGVKSLDATDVLLHHVLPYAREHVTATDHAAAMAFVLEYAAGRAVAAPVVAAVREALHVRTTRGQLVPLAQPHLFLSNPSVPSTEFEMLPVVDAGAYGDAAPAFFASTLRLPCVLALDGDSVPGLDTVVAYATETRNVAVASALLRYLDTAWRGAHTTTLTSAVACLAQHAWVPVQVAQGSVCLVRPNVAFVLPKTTPPPLRKFHPVLAIHVTNPALLAMLNVRQGLGVDDVVALLKSARLDDSAVVACYHHLGQLWLELDDAARAALRAAFAATPLLRIGAQRWTTSQCVWKMAESALPGIVALAGVLPKTVKDFVLAIGVPATPTMATVIGALTNGAVDDTGPYLAFVAANWHDAIVHKAALEAVPFLTSTAGQRVALATDLRWTKGVPSWYPALQLSQPLVDISASANAPFEALIQAWPTHGLEHAITTAPDEWSARAVAVCADAAVPYTTKQALVLDVLTLWKDAGVATLLKDARMYPTQAQTFVPIGDVCVLVAADGATGSPPQLPHPALLDLPIDETLRGYLVGLGASTLPFATRALCDFLVEDESRLRDHVCQQLDAAADKLPPTTVALSTLRASLRCAIVANLRVEYAIEGRVVRQNKVPIALLDGRLYIEEPVHEYAIYLTLAQHLYGASELASSVANALFVTSLQPPTTDAAVNTQHLWSHVTPTTPSTKRRRDWAQPQALEPAGKRARPANGAVFQVAMAPPPYAQQAPYRPQVLTEEMRLAIGRAGEAHVYELLRATHGDAVEWVNELQETGLPYDICINGGSGGREYIEVKSTSTFDKVVFEMSVQELDFAGQHGSQYIIYRVFQVKPHVGPVVDCPIVKLRNPMTLLKQKKLKLSIAMDDSVLRN
ncbi:phosphoserine aminotransferase [Achlya hypogyna]|uniref:Phosphoserine aminotransferase n=1 Tax=Achlya hypogyna TaxID=1202772 RepID=A0A1V9YPP1_ACHHY|nr:phosphoserine aminotransferase [Achlya hypogyna]